MLMIEDKIAKIINALEISAQFGGNSDEDYYEDVEDMGYSLSKKTGEKLQIFHGVSKCAIVVKNLNFVIKVPFNGAYYTQENYNEETEQYEYGEDEWVDFSYANDLNDDNECWDYCGNELSKYEKAVEDGFGRFFAETKYYGEKCNFPIYLQEKVIAFNDDTSNKIPSKKAVSEYASEKYRDIRYTCPSKWVELAIDWYVGDAVIELFKYLNKNDLDSDLHGGNVGYKMSGQPILLDWAGWRE